MTRPAPMMLQIDCLRQRGLLAQRAGDFPRAIAARKQSLALLERAGDTKDLAYTTVLNDLTIFSAGAGDFKGASQWNERAERAFVANGRGNTVGRMAVLVNRATNLFEVGEIRQSADVMVGSAPASIWPTAMQTRHAPGSKVFSLTSAIRKSALHYNFRTRFLLPLRSSSIPVVPSAPARMRAKRCGCLNGRHWTPNKARTSAKHCSYQGVSNSLAGTRRLRMKRSSAPCAVSPTASAPLTH